MRNLMMTTILALAAGPLWADDVALVLGNERYDRLDRVVQGDDVAAGAIALTRAGVRVYSTLNANASDMRIQARDFLRDRDDVTGQITVLSGQFVTDGARTWFLGRDAIRPNAFAPGDQAILVETLLTVLAQTPGQALLVIGHDESADDDLGGGLREGIGTLDIPQGVSVVQGRPGSVATFVSDTLAQPGGDVMEAVRRTRRLSATGFVPQVLSFGTATDDTSGEPPVVTLNPNRDTEDWQRAQSLDTANGYAAYLNRHPRGAYADEARTVLEEIRSEPNRAQRLAEESLRLNRDARRAVQRDLTVLDFDTRGIDGIFGPGTRRAIANWQQQNGFAQTTYLTTNQINRMDAQAARRSQELEAEAARQKAAEEARDRTFWAETGSRGNEAGLSAYLQRYPDGTYSDVAEEQLAAIIETKRAQARAQDRDAWDQARERNTVSAYRNYLSNNRQGAFRDNATARIERLQQDDNDAPARAAAEQQEEAMRLDPLSRRIIEARLTQLGLDPGQVDGTFDSRTRRAIRRYQRDRNLTRTGFLNQETVSRLLRDGTH